MLLEFIQKESRPGILPELVKVDGAYAIRCDDTIFALDGSRISAYETLEVVTQISSGTSSTIEPHLLTVDREGESILLLLLADGEKRPADAEYYDYFGAYAHDADEYFESFKFIELSDTGFERLNTTGFDYKANRKEIEISSIDYLALRRLENYQVVPKDATLVHCGVNPQWHSLMVYAETTTINGVEKLRVRTFNAEIFAFSGFKDETELITNSGDFLPTVLREFTPVELASGQKVTKEYLKKWYVTDVTSFLVSSAIGVKLRPAKTFVCDMPSTDDNTDPILTRDDVLDALNLDAASRELISKVRNTDVLTLVWRDRENAQKFWIAYSSARNAVVWFDGEA